MPEPIPFAQLAKASFKLLAQSYASDATATLEAKSATKATRALLGQRTGVRLLAQRLSDTLEPWFVAEIRDSIQVFQGMEAACRIFDHSTLSTVAMDGLIHPLTAADSLLKAHEAQIDDLDEPAQAVCREAVRAGLVELKGMFLSLDSSTNNMLAELLERAGEDESRHEELLKVLSQLLTKLDAKEQRPALAPTEHPDELIHAFGETRMARYIELAGSREGALRLYQWNIEMSAELYRGLHIVEVVLRNAIDLGLRSWNAQAEVTGTPVWTTAPHPTINKAIGDAVDQAWDRATRERRAKGLAGNPSHDEVIGQMSFGAWRFLLPTNGTNRHARSRRRLWQDALLHAFPFLDPVEASGTGLRHRLDALWQVRNRVAHLEPVLSSEENRATFHHITYVLNAINPFVGAWFISQQGITHLLRTKPNEMRATH